MLHSSHTLKKQFNQYSSFWNVTCADSHSWSSNFKRGHFCYWDNTCILTCVYKNNGEDVHQENNLTKEKRKQSVGLVFGGIWTTCLAFSGQLKTLSSFSRCAIRCSVSGCLLLIRKTCLPGCLVADVTSNLILGNRLKDVLAEPLLMDLILQYSFSLMVCKSIRQ